jgi:activator of HSP90 ATPase
MGDRIHEEFVYDAPADRIFDILTDGAQFSAMSGGAPGNLGATAGDEFSCFGGMIHGRNVEVAQGKLPVQAWRAKNWSEGVYSMVRFERQSEGPKTRVVLDLTGLPEGQGEHLEENWHTNYWTPLGALLAG